MLAGRIGHLLGSTAPGAEGVGAGIRLPAVLPLMGRIAVLARDDWAGLSRVPNVLDTVLGGLAAAARSRSRARKGSPAEAAQAAWVAVGSRPIDGVGSLAGTYADLVDATRTAQRLGLRGWIPDPEQLALERLLLADPQLADATVRRELGPLLADERFGEELIETLQAYFDAGENVTAAARRLHLATRTVAYRLEKIESLLGHPLDGENGRRLSTALMVHRLRSVELGALGAGIIARHAVQDLVDQAALHLAAPAQRALESKTEMLAEATHGDVVLVGREPHAERASLVEQVRQEQRECLESETLPALLRIHDQDSDLVHIARVTEGARDGLHHAEQQSPRHTPNSMP